MNARKKENKIVESTAPSYHGEHPIVLSLCWNRKIKADVNSAIEGFKNISPHITRHTFWLISLDAVEELDLIMTLNPDIVIVDSEFIKEIDFDALTLIAPEAEIIRIVTSENGSRLSQEKWRQWSINSTNFDRGVDFTLDEQADPDLLHHAIRYLFSRHIIRLNAQQLSNNQGV